MDVVWRLAHSGAPVAGGPALINRGYGRAFFWDGRMTSLDEQVLMPIQDPDEMDMTLAEASAPVRRPVDDMAGAGQLR